MKSFFGRNQNPDAKDLQELASRTGLGKRVLQVLISYFPTYAWMIYWRSFKTRQLNYTSYNAVCYWFPIAEHFINPRKIYFIGRSDIQDLSIAIRYRLNAGVENSSSRTLSIILYDDVNCTGVTIFQNSKCRIQQNIDAYFTRRNGKIFYSSRSICPINLCPINLWLKETFVGSELQSTME